MQQLGKVRRVFNFVMLVVIGVPFVHRAIEWEKGLTGDFIVYGQTGGTTPPPVVPPGGFTSGSPGTVPPGFIVKAIPEVAMGQSASCYGYATTIQVVNSGSSAVTVSGFFFNEDGSAFSQPMTLNASTPITFTGNFSGSLAANSMLVISGAGSGNQCTSTQAIGWGEIISSANVTVNATIDLDYCCGGTPQSRSSILPSPTNMQRFVVPRSSLVTPNQTGLITTQNTYTRDVAVALVNTGPTTAEVNATLFTTAGQILASSSVVMGPFTHKSVFAHDLFDLNETNGAGQTFIEFESFSPQWAAAALTFEGNISTSVVVEKIE